MSEQTRFILNQTDLPKFWYNINADSPVKPAPVLHPGTKEPVTPDFLSVLFPMELILQEISTERYIQIPEEVRDIYRLYRPTPLIRAVRLEKALGTPAHIYYKYEGESPVGSHKPNTAIPQAFYNKAAGTKALTTETGAGQWGSALAFATAQYGMECEIWQVAASYRQKPYRRTMMEIWGATVHPSPSELTEYGRSLLAENPDHPGSLGIAISEAVAMAVADPNTRYSLGSVLNHVLLHQTIIGLEAVYRSPHDGYTLVMEPSNLPILGPLYGKLPFDPIADFAPIVLVGSSPVLIAGHLSDAAFSYVWAHENEKSERYASSALTTFGLVPEVERPRATSPGRPSASTCRAKTYSKA